VGEIPEYWEVASIGDIVEMAQYGISESLSQSGEYPIFRMNNMENGYMVGEPMKYIDLDDEEFEKYRVEKCDILFNRTNSHELVGKTGIFELDGDYVFASYLVRLRTNDRADPYYLNYYMNSEQGQNRLQAFATKGVSQSNINATSVQRVKLPLPPRDEQQEIADITKSIDTEIEENETYREQLIQLKTALMQDLLTGEVRTAGREIDIPDEVKNYEPE
jgi:type I restriction enzyme S subunit